MRKDFSKATKRDALKRSGKRCEAVGAAFGFEPGQRCNADLALGVEFHHDHEAETGGDASLENCRAICIKCHRHVTKAFIRELRHSDRVWDRHNGITKPKSKLSKAYRQEALSRMRQEVQE